MEDGTPWAWAAVEGLRAANWNGPTRWNSERSADCMKTPHRLRSKTFVLILLMVVFGPLGDVLLGKGMKQVGATSSWSPTGLGQLFLRAFFSGYIWLGIGFLLLFFVAYLLVLSWADYSFVQPA